MSEGKVTFHNDKGQRIVGVLHVPERPGKFPAVLICHGFKGNKDKITKTALAKRLCEEGFVALRFDFANNGESEGAFENNTVTQQVADLKCAIDFTEKILNVNKEKIGVTGDSLGGMVVILQAARDRRIRTLVPIAPLSAPRRFERKYTEMGTWEGEKLTFKDRRTGALYTVKLDLFTDVMSYNMLTEVEKIKCPVLVIQGTADRSVLLDDTKGLFKMFNEPKELGIVEGADHIFTNPEHLEKMINLAVGWFKRWLR